MTKNTFISILLVIFLNGCSGLKEELSLKKKRDSNEFLVDKKPPLVMPPDFSKLPIPSDEMNSTNSKDEKETINLSSVFNDAEDKSANSTNTTNLEKAISNILNKK